MRCKTLGLSQQIITVILHQNNEPSCVNEEPRTMQIKYITRLLGRPQPQMYPPVALNQYTWANRTHKHFLYMLQGPIQINRFNSKAILQQHVKYGSNLMKICYKLFFNFWGVLGKRMLNPEVLKCHEDLITRETGLILVSVRVNAWSLEKTQNVSLLILYGI